jgi:hypothetical protein
VFRAMMILEFDQKHTVLGFTKHFTATPHILANIAVDLA